MKAITKRRLGTFCTALGLSGAVLALDGGAASAHEGPEPEPVVIPEGNFTCSDFAATHGGGQQWLEVKFDTGELQSGTKDGVTLVWNGDNTFDFSSTMGIDAVFVKSGSQGSHLYVYAPTAQSSETFFDDGLTAPQDISHISFCYDDSATTTTAPPPPPPPPPPPTTTTTTTEATTTTTEAPTTTAPATTTTEPGEVEGITVTAAPPPTPPTEVGGVQASQPLPRTGTDSGRLLALSAGLLVGGLVLVLLGDGARVLGIRRH
jgi:hypothetical protein